MKKKKILGITLINAILALPIATIAASCNKHSKTKPADNKEKDKTFTKKDDFVQQLKDIDSSSKSELFFNGIYAKGERKIITTGDRDDWNLYFGLLGPDKQKITIPKGYRVVIEKEQFSNILSFQVAKAGFQNLISFDVEIKNFTPIEKQENLKSLEQQKEIEYEAAIKNSLNRLSESIKSSNLLKEEFLLKSDDKYALDDLQTDIFTDADNLSDALSNLTIFKDLGLNMQGTEDALKGLEGMKKIKLNKKFNSQTIDLVLDGYRDNGAPYYAVKTSLDLKDFLGSDPVTEDEKINYVGRLLESCNGRINSKLSKTVLESRTFTDKPLNDVINDANLEDAEKIQISIPTILTNYLNEKGLETKISKILNTSNLEVTVNSKTDTTKTVSKQLKIVPRYSNYRGNVLNAKGFAFNKYLLNERLGFLQIFGQGPKTAWLRLEDGYWPTAPVDLTSTVDPKINVSAVLLDPYRPEISYSAGVTRAVPIISLNRFFAGNYKIIKAPDSQIQNVWYTPQQFLRTADKNRIVVIVKTTNEGKYYVGYLNLEKETFEQKIDTIEIRKGEIVKTLMYTPGEPSDGYLIVTNNTDATTGEKSSRVLRFDKKMKFVSKNWGPKINRRPPEFRWHISDVIHSGDGGYWVFGKNGEYAYLNADGTVFDPQNISSLNFKINDVFLNGENEILAVGEKGQIKIYKVTPEIHKLDSIIFEETALDGLDIQAATKDSKGFLYLMGTRGTGTAAEIVVEKLDPSFQHDAWEKGSPTKTNGRFLPK